MEISITWKNSILRCCEHTRNLVLLSPPNAALFTYPSTHACVLVRAYTYDTWCVFALLDGCSLYTHAHACAQAHIHISKELCISLPPHTHAHPCIYMYRRMHKALAISLPLWSAAHTHPPTYAYTCIYTHARNLIYFFAPVDTSVPLWSVCSCVYVCLHCIHG